MLVIKIEKRKLTQTLNQLKSSLRRISRKGKEYVQCEITVTDNKITIAIPGMILETPCSVFGAVKVSIPFMYFYRLIEDIKRKPMIKITVTEGELSIGIVSVEVETTFFEDDSILRTIRLPMNYTDLDLLRLVKSGKYTFDELYFNKLTVKVDNAERHLKRDINYAYRVLNPYGVTKQEIEEILERSI